MVSLKTRPTRFQFSLLSMFIVVAVCGVLAKLAIVWDGKAKHQAAVSEKIVKLGGMALYDYQCYPDFDWQRPSPTPAWLSSALGEDWFHSIVAVELLQNTVHDKDLEILSNLPQIKFVEIWSSELTDAGLLSLGKCKGLKMIYFKPNHCSDRAIAELKRELPDCEFFEIQPYPGQMPRTSSELPVSTADGQ